MKIINFRKFNESSQKMTDEVFQKMVQDMNMDEDSRKIIQTSLEKLGTQNNPSQKDELVQDILLQIGDELDNSDQRYKSIEDWLKKK
jgi:hypothetical protein